jgi:hypothetical protein
VGNYYYLMSLLPPLPAALGQPLGAEVTWLAAQARQSIAPADRETLEVHLLCADVANFISRETGREKFLPGGRLTLEGIDTQEGLPEVILDFLKGQADAPARPYVYDRLWEMYHARALGTAERSGNAFLKKYLPWEIQLRNALTSLRASAAGLDPAGYLVAPNQAGYSFDKLLSGLGECPGPLEAERYLDRERLKFISGCLDHDGFSLGALLGYLSQAYIFSRWQDQGKPFDLDKITFAGEVK